MPCNNQITVIIGHDIKETSSRVNVVIYLSLYMYIYIYVYIHVTE